MFVKMDERIYARNKEMTEEMGATMEKMDEKMDARNKEMKEEMGGRMEVMNEKLEMMDTKTDKQKDNIFTSLIEKFQKEVEANKNEIEKIKEGRKTNLENVGNIVGENMISMVH